jgi:ADP-heptose:LPS heptosyltransferase
MVTVDILKSFSYESVNYQQSISYVMSEEHESTLRAVKPEAIGMSHPLVLTNQYKGEDLTGKKLMVFRSGGIGDIFMLSPVLRWLNFRYPTSQVKVATGCKEPLENLPYISELLTMPFPAHHLTGCDYMLHFQGILEGGGEDSKKYHGTDLFFRYFGIDPAWIISDNKRPHISISAAEIAWVQQTLKDRELTPGKDYIIGIQLETSSPIRNFPKDKLKQIIDILAIQPMVKIVLIGSESQTVAAEYLRDRRSNILVATKYTVRQSIVLASKYDLIISGDSMMIQVACGYQIPCIGLYGPFPSNLRMKYHKDSIGLDADVVCAPCYKHDYRGCIKGTPSPCWSTIKIEDILKAADYLRYLKTLTHYSFMSGV